MNIRYSYNGTEFLLREITTQGKRPFLEVHGLISHGSEVIIPTTVNGYDVKGLRFSKERSINDSAINDQCFYGVRRLVLPTSMRIFSMYNTNFPDLEEKITFALKILEENGDAGGRCEAFIRHSAAEIADDYIADGKEEKLIGFIQKKYMEADDMRITLKKCNDKGLSLSLLRGV